MEDNPSIGHEGQYFIVLNNDSEYGVSLLMSTPLIGAQFKAASFRGGTLLTLSLMDVIGIPRHSLFPALRSES